MQKLPVLITVMLAYNMSGTQHKPVVNSA